MTKRKKYINVEVRLPKHVLDTIDRLVAGGWFEDRNDAAVFMVRAEMIRMALLQMSPKPAERHAKRPELAHYKQRQA